MKISNLTFGYGALPVLDRLSIDFAEGAITAVLGPSGCGKTTLLKILAGMLAAAGVDGRAPHEPTSRLDVDEVSHSTGQAISSSFLFQEPRLLPWLTARRNVEFALPAADMGRAAAYLDLVGLGAFADYRPAALSGGMRQRVAIARAFAFRSERLFMDEPFQGLDIALKRQLVQLFVDLWKSDRRTTVLVTHDVPEALLLGDVIVVLSKRPARVVLTVENQGRAGERSLTSPDLARVERTVYDALLSQS